MSHDFLNDPLLETDAGWFSLPGLLAALARQKVRSYPALRPHQRPAWHMFLVQLGVLALSSAGRTELPDDEDTWRAALRGLTSGFPGDEPWQLVVEDRSKPAFLQAPDPGRLKWSEVATPDELDMLITSRNHDLKRHIAHRNAPQDWIYALVSVQTMEGFGGAGNYGIVRMNGGSSSRVLIGLAPGSSANAVVDPSAWWRRDVEILMRSRSTVDGKSLLWLDDWPEAASLSLPSLDPMFIEICRRIRLETTDQGLVARRSTSKAARISGKDAKGNVGDPWAPVHLAEGKSLTLGERDWSYELLTQLLFSKSAEWTTPRLAKEIATESDDDMLLVTEAFSRGNSKTDGFKSRVIPVPKAVVRYLFRERPIHIAPDLINDIAEIERALRNGLAAIAAEGDREKIGKTHYARTLPARQRFRRYADSVFFEELWARVAVKSDAELAPLRKAFLDRLAAAARAEFDRAKSSIPCASLWRHRAEVRGERAMNTVIFHTQRDLAKEASDA